MRLKPLRRPLHQWFVKSSYLNIRAAADCASGSGVYSDLTSRPSNFAQSAKPLTLPSDFAPTPAVTEVACPGNAESQPATRECTGRISFLRTARGRIPFWGTGKGQWGANMGRFCVRRGAQLRRIGVAAVVATCGIAGGVCADEVRIAAKVGDLVDGGGGTQVRFSRFSGFTNAYTPIVSPSGHVMFTAEVTGTGVIGANNRGMWRGDRSGNAELAARVGAGAWAPSSSLFYNTLLNPMINSDGHCAFQSSLGGSGSTSTTAQSFWCFAGTTPQLLVRGGESLVGVASDIDVSTFSEQAWIRNRNGGGRLMFKSALVGPGVTTTNNRAVCADGIGTAAALSLARAGTPLDEFPTLTCKEPYRAANAHGEAVLYASLMGSGIVLPSTTGAPVVPNDQIIWLPDASTPVARAGNSATGAASSLKFSSLFYSGSLFRRPQLNSLGTVAFTPNLCDATGVPVASGIWTSRAGTLRPVVVSGDAAPGLPAGVTIGTPIASTITMGYQLCDNDSVVFVSQLVGPGVSFGSDKAIFRMNANGTKQLLVRGGQQAPDAAPGVVITNDSIGRCARVNANGDIAFVATIAGGDVVTENNVAVFSNVGGRLKMVARKGQLIAECDDWRFVNLIAEPSFYFNDLGQILVSGSANHASTGYGTTGGWFRVDQNNEFRAAVLGSEIVPNQDGPRVRFGGVSTSVQVSLSNSGEFAMISSLLTGGSVEGESIVVIKIVPADPSSPSSSGACCTGVQCAASTQTSCSAAFKGVGTVCDAPANPVICCPANFNGTDGVSVQDLFDFIIAFYANDSRADFNRSGQLTVQDIFDYLAAYLALC